MIRVLIVKSNAVLIVKNEYSYKDFDNLSEDLGINESVEFILMLKKKKIYQGQFLKSPDMTVHLDISFKLKQMVIEGKLKEKKADQVISLLEDEFNVPDVAIKDSISKSPHIKKEKKKEEKVTETPSFAFPANSFKKIFLTLVILLTLIGLFLGGKTYLGNRKETDQTTKTSYSTLIEEKSYLIAGKEFPEKIKDIEKAIVAVKDFDALKEFNEEYPTPEGKFDLSFYLENWEAVIETDQSTLTKERQIMLAYAYIKLDRLDEADILNKKLMSEKLTKQINTARKFEGIKAVQNGEFNEAQKIQERIDDRDLYELIQTGKSCKEMIDYYKEKEDQENELIWKNRLENLGKDYLSNE